MANFQSILSDAINTCDQATSSGTGFGAGVCSLNFVEGVLSIAAGVRLLLDTDEHQLRYTRLKAITHLLSGMQICIFTYNPVVVAALGLSGGFTLAPVALTLSMLCDLVNAIIEFLQAHKVMTYSGWCEDRCLERAAIQSRIKEIDNESAKLGRISGKDNKNNVDLSCFSSYGNSEKVEKRLNELSMLKNKLLERENVISANVSEEAWQKNAVLQADLRHKRKRAMINVALNAAKFIGMSIVATVTFVPCSPVHIAAIIFVAIASATYIYVNRDKIKKDLGSMKRHLGEKFGFFQPDKKDDPETKNHKNLTPANT